VGQVGSATNNARDGKPVYVVDPGTLNRPTREALVADDFVAGGARGCARVEDRLLCWGRTLPEENGSRDHRWPIVVP
jgi:hypothetical protein